MSTVNTETMTARRNELNNALEALRGDMVKIEDMRTSTLGQMQQLLGAIQILNEMIGASGTTDAGSTLSEKTES